MGCGQSNIQLYPKKSKNKSNGKKRNKSDHIDETDDHDANEKNDAHDDILSNGNDDSPEPDAEDVSVSLQRSKNLSLLQSQNISNSQQNFFRMIDQKIEDGPDYDSSSETELALEEARLNALVQHWESASLPTSVCSSTSRSLQSTPIRQVQLRQTPSHLCSQVQQPLLANNNSSQPLKSQTISPNRDGRSLLSQTVIHQSYGVSPHSTGISQATRQRNNSITSAAMYSPHPNSYYGEVYHPLLISPHTTATVTEPRFPHAISVQRLAPQVQRQIRETQELIKDSCPQLYAAGYGSPGPPVRAMQMQQQQLQQHQQQQQQMQPQRAGPKKNLEIHYSQELS